MIDDCAAKRRLTARLTVSRIPSHISTDICSIVLLRATVNVEGPIFDVGVQASDYWPS